MTQPAIRPYQIFDHLLTVELQSNGQWRCRCGETGNTVLATPAELRSGALSRHFVYQPRAATSIPHAQAFAAA